MSLPHRSILGDEYTDYISVCIPFFIIMSGAEFLYSCFKKQNRFDFSVMDSISSLSTGLTTIIIDKLIPSSILKSLEFICVIYIYKNYRLITLDESSIAASFLCLLLVDFGYYWFHRLAHEINILWSSHVTHHSSELYNFTTALRQNVFQPFVSWVFYLPLGLFMPPGIFFFHKQFNTIFQFWVHTKYIGKLPRPIEFILNTPSHHRVHHGRNPIYLDKNYAGVFIIWDRMFGTFEEEKEEVYYGLVESLDSHDPTWCQVHHLVKCIVKSITQYDNWGDTLRSLMYSPGWKKGDKTRMGEPLQLPQPKPEEKPIRMGHALPPLFSFYTFLHFNLIAVVSLVVLALFERTVPSSTITVVMLYLYLSLTSMAALNDRRHYATILELIRLVLLIVYTYDTKSLFIQGLRGFYLLSSIYIGSKLQFKKNKLK